MELTLARQVIPTQILSLRVESAARWILDTKRLAKFHLQTMVVQMGFQPLLESLSNGSNYNL